MRRRQRRLGRPSREEAALLEEHILEVATELFFAGGYGETSIELLARHAGASKRTIYDRFGDKAGVFKAVMRRVVERLRPPDVAALFAGDDLAEILTRLSRAVLRAALQPEAIALHRLIIAESGRFPELAELFANRPGSQEAIERISALLQAHGRPTRQKSAEFAAAQFLQMTIAVPQRRAMGMGAPMNEAELDAWAEQTVRLFLVGWQEMGRDRRR